MRRSQTDMLEAENSRIFAYLWEKIRPHSKRLAVNAICASLIGLIASIDPLLFRHLIDYSLARRDGRSAFMTVGLIALFLLCRASLSAVATLSGFRTKQMIGENIRTGLLSQLMKLSPPWHEKTKLGEKLDWFGADVEEISQVASVAVQILCRTLLLLILNTFIMYRLNPLVTAAFIPILPLFLMLRWRFKALIRRQSDSAKVISEKANAVLTEQLDAIPDLDLLGAGEYRFLITVLAWKNEMVAKYRVRRTEIFFGATVTCVFTVSVILVLGLSIHQVLLGRMTTGSLIAFYSYVAQIFEPISNVMELYSQSQRMQSSLKRVKKVLATVPSVLDEGTLQEPLFHLADAIVLRQVSFGYQSTAMILENLSLTIHAGETVAIVGKSGSGKSTLARLLVRFINPLDGTISLDGKDIRDYSLGGLRKTICYIPQSPKLFSGTILDNLLYGNPNGTEEQVQRAIEAARFTSRIRHDTGGLDEELGPAGFGLSGGERQRLAIARALLRDSAVLVMDEATAALDSENERAILELIPHFKRGRTTIVISHRLKSLNWVDRFILLGEGQVQAEGTLAELLASNTVFRELYEAG